MNNKNDNKAPIKNNTSVNANKSKSYSKSISRQSNDKSNIELSMSSIKSIYQAEKHETDEIPLNNSAIKSKMVKDIKRIYGSKFDKLFVIWILTQLKEISSNKGLLDNILKTFKLAKDKMAKVGIDNKDNDDILVNNIINYI